MELENQDTPQIRPWIRFFAYTIDIWIWNTVLAFLWHYLSPNTYKPFSKFAMGSFLFLTEYVLWSFIEAALLSKYGFTFGKWSLNVIVRDADNHNLSYNKAIKRAVGRFIFGEGMAIPYLVFFTNIMSYNRLKNQGITRWDEDGNISVSHKEIETYKAVLATLIFIGAITFRCVRKI